MRIVITVNPTTPEEIDALAGRLSRSGMSVDQILSTTGIITGTADDASVAAIRGLSGVASVEPDAEFQIPTDGPQ